MDILIMGYKKVNYYNNTKSININMIAGILNFNGNQVHACEQGADFLFVFSYEDANGTTLPLSEYTMKMQVRKNYGKELILEISTANGRITVDSNEDATIHVTAEDTAELPPGKYIYDMEVIDGQGIVSRFLKGEFVITAEVTL